MLRINLAQKKGKKGRGKGWRKGREQGRKEESEEIKKLFIQTTLVLSCFS